MTTPRKVKVLRNLKISEVSAVDRGAGENCRIVLRKGAEPRSFADVLWLNEVRKSMMTGGYSKWRRNDDGDVGAGGGHPLSELADLIVEGSDGKLDRAAVLRWLLHHKDGVAAARAHKRSEETPMTRAEHLDQIAKDFGVTRIAKFIIDQSDPFLSEAEFTKLIDDHAQAGRKAGETREQCFTRAYTARTEDGATLRRAHQLVRDATLRKAAGLPFEVTLQPRLSSGLEALTDASGPLAQLQALGRELHRQSPWMSPEQAFSRIYTDPANAALVRREREAARARLRAG
jgi:hypothetical protein